MRYIKNTKEAPRLTVKFVKESTADVILEVPITVYDMMDYFNAEFITSVLRNSFGEDKFKSIGDIRIFIDQPFILGE
jgi:hypothetical protein